MVYSSRYQGEEMLVWLVIVGSVLSMCGSCLFSIRKIILLRVVCSMDYIVLFFMCVVGSWGFDSCL